MEKESEDKLVLLSDISPTPSQFQVSAEHLINTINSESPLFSPLHYNAATPFLSADSNPLAAKLAGFHQRKMSIGSQLALQTGLLSISPAAAEPTISDFIPIIMPKSSIQSSSNTSFSHISPGISPILPSFSQEPLFGKLEAPSLKPAPERKAKSLGDLFFEANGYPLLRFDGSWDISPGETSFPKTESYGFSCNWDKCRKSFNTLNNLVDHLKTDHVHSKNDEFICMWNDCPRNQAPFYKRYKIISHLRTHTGEKPFKCDYPGCHKVFNRKDSLVTHRETHEEKQLQCTFPGCLKKYYHIRSLKKHMRLHQE